jgi:hypothetical protein
MTRRLIALLVLVAAVAAVFADGAVATTPPRPPQPPSVYVQTAAYNNGCSDWYLQSNYPMSTANPKWVFSCSNTYWYDPSDPEAWYQTYDSYFWNADSQKAILWDYGVWDNWMGWYWDCPFYFVGACPT